MRAFITLSELAIALVEALSEKPERDRNPLSRRHRDIGGVGVEYMIEKNHLMREWLE